MDVTMKNKTPIQPRTMAELMPCIKAIMTKDAVKSLSCKKKSRTTVVQTYTCEKNFKPMNIEGLRGNLSALKPPSSRFPQPSASSARMKPWNSSIKVDKTKSLTADGQMKHSTVRKTLKFQQKPIANIRATMAAPVAKKSLYAPVPTGLGSGISGVWKMPETPRINVIQRVTNSTKVENISFKSSSDASFLQREKEINDFEEKTNALTEEPTLERIAEVSPPVSTPFNDYRNVREYFNDTCNDENSNMDNTIMCFDNTTSVKKNNNNREESDLVSLCEMLTKATVMNSDNNNTELDKILELEKQTENHLKIVDTVISLLNNLKDKHLASLKHIRKLKDENYEKCKSKEEVTSVQAECKPSVNVKQENLSIADSPIKRPTVITCKSPTYKVPRKSICLRKKVVCKTLPKNSDGLRTPTKSDRALNMYLQIKEQMTFLNTPLNKGSYLPTPDTPAITSHNLKKQLDKLYNES